MRRIPTLLLALLASSDHASAADFTITPTTVSGVFRWSVQLNGTGSALINPTLSLMRGRSYSFAVNASGTHPFWIKTVSSTGFGNAYAGTGLSANDVTSTTTITFDVPSDAPDQLFYNCGNHASMAGRIDISIFADGFGD